MEQRTGGATLETDASRGALLAGRGRFLRRRLVLVAAAVGGAVLAPATAAHANVVGVGNATFGNQCTTVSSGTQAQGATTHGSGVLGGNAAQAPLELSRQHCGNSGIICVIGVL